MNLFAKKSQHEFYFVFIISTPEEKLETTIFEESRKGKEMVLSLVQTEMTVFDPEPVCLLSKDWAHLAVYKSEATGVDSETQEHLKQSVRDFFEQTYQQRLKRDCPMSVVFFYDFSIGVVHLKAKVSDFLLNADDEKERAKNVSQKTASEWLLETVETKVAKMVEDDQLFYYTSREVMKELFDSVLPGQENLQDVIVKIKEIGESANAKAGFDGMSTLFGLFLKKYPWLHDSLDLVWRGTGSWETDNSFPKGEVASA